MAITRFIDQPVSRRLVVLDSCHRLGFEFGIRIVEVRRVVFRRFNPPPIARRPPTILHLQLTFSVRWFLDPLIF